MFENSRDWTIVTYDRSFLKALFAFLESQHQPGTDKGRLDESYYAWKLHDTPCGDGAAGLAVTTTGRVIGSTVASLKPFLFRGEPIAAAEMGDSYTHPDFRRQGILSRVSQRARDTVLHNPATVIYTTPNELSVGGYLKQGYRQPDWYRVTYWVRPQRFLTLCNRSLPRPLAPPVAATLRTGTALASLVLAPRPARDLTWHTVDRFPADVNRIWNSGSQRFQFVRVRDVDTLDWRFRMSGRLPYQYLLCRQNNTPVGFAVTATVSIKGLRVLLLADYFFSAETDWTRATLTLLSLLSRNREHDLLGTWLLRSRALHAAYAPTSSQMFRLGFLPLKNMNLLFDPQSLPESYLDSPFPFHFTMSDSDNI